MKTSDLAKRLTKMVTVWPGVEIRRSKFSPATAFFVGAREFAHFHGPHEIDIRVTRAVQREHKTLLEFDERVGFRERASEWVTFSFFDAADLQRATALLRLAGKPRRLKNTLTVRRFRTMLP